MNAETIKETGGSLAEIARGMAARIARQSRPVTPQLHLIRGAGAAQLFVPNGSRLHQISASTESCLESLLELKDEQGIQFELAALGMGSSPRIDDTPLQNPPLHALSLAIAQKCNMGCSYCYAGQGNFGGPAKKMSLETAIKSIDLLINGREQGESVQLTFLGGEPLINRKDIRLATEYAQQLGSAKKVNVGFSITTNGTLLTADDAQFFEKFGFAVTISLDGLAEEHDRLRPLKSGGGSFARIIENVKPLLAAQKNMQVSARVTVTPINMNLARTLDEFIEMGFHSVGFSPLLKSSNGQREMTGKDLENLLAGMIECGLKFEQSVLRGQRYPFLNMVNALKEIGKGTHRPYPCGAGAGYMGVSADGDLAACHRFVNEPHGKMGDIEKGIDASLQNRWLAERHVHRQSPCHSCWARYLCGGSCHHEVIDRDRKACDYIRGWLYYTLQAFERLNRLAPAWNQ